MRSRHMGGAGRLGQALILSLLAILVSIGLGQPRQTQAVFNTRFVAVSGSNAPNNCLTLTTPCKTITYALTQANPGDTIQIGAGLYDTLLGEVFPLGITNALTVTGAGPGSTTINATGSLKPVLNVTNGGGTTVTMSGLTITGGTTAGAIPTGAGISFVGAGTLNLSNATVSGNAASCTIAAVNCAGGIYNGVGTANLNNVTVSNNTSTINGGGIFTNNLSTMTLTNVTISFNSTNNSLGTGNSGGGMFAGHGTTVTLNNSTVTGNNSVGSGGGIENDQGTMVLNSVTISNNSAGNLVGQSGGGIENYNGATLTLNNTTVSSNTASLSGGGMENTSPGSKLNINNSTITGNTANGGPPPAGGGGISNVNGGTLTVTGSTISNNTATGGNGGGISDTTTNALNISNSTISGNSVSSVAQGRGGGIVTSGALTATNDTFSNNQANGANELGGALSLPCAVPTATLTNVTFSNNQSGQWGGAIDGCSLAGSLNLTNATFSGNAAVNRGGALSLDMPLNATNVTFVGNSTTNGAIVNFNNVTTTFHGVLLADSPTIGDTECVFLGAGAVHVSNGGSVADDGTCFAANAGQGDLINAGVTALAPLANNGGFTQTIALLPGNPAIDDSPPPCPTATDQRAIARPQGPGCDSGAFELVPPPPPAGGGGGGGGGGGQVPPSILPEVNNLTVQANPATAGANSNYTLGFTTGLSGILRSAAAITANGPAGTSFPSDASKYSLSASNGHTASVGSVAVSKSTGSGTNNVVLITLGSSTISAADTATLNFGGVTNPPAGTYTLTLATTTDFLAATSAPYVITAGPASTPTPAPTPSPTPTSGCATVTYAAGWNLAGGPTSTTLTGAVSSLFTFQASDSAYESFPPGTALSGGIGVWAFFLTPTTVTLPCVTAQTLRIALPANHFIMVGNPDDVAVSVSGADVVDTFNPGTNTYTTVTGTATLQPGRGAWLFSRAGGTLTLTPTGS